MTNDIKGETIIAIGEWSQSQFWREATALAKIEHIALFIATKPYQRRNLGRIGEVRLTMEEARNIIMMKKKATNFFATVAVQKFAYVDDYLPVDQANRAYATAFELFLEYGIDHIS